MLRGFTIRGFGLGVSRFRVSNRVCSRFGVSGGVFEVRGFGGTGFLVICSEFTRFGVSGWGFRGSGFRVQGFGVRGFGLRSFRYKVPGAWFRDSVFWD